MQIFKKEILQKLKELEGLTSEIYSIVVKSSEVDNQILAELYDKRSTILADVEQYVMEDGKELIEQNQNDWMNLMVPILELDKKSLEVLKNKVSGLEDKIKTKNRQKSVLAYNK